MSYPAEFMRTNAFLTGVPVRGIGTSLVKRRFLLGAAALLLVSGVGFALYQDAGAKAPPVTVTAVPVTVATIEPRPVRLWSEFSGHMTAVDAADIRPEVSGRITDIRFHNGQTVHAGDILFVIDPRPYEAEVAKAQADLATANTNAKLAKTELGRASRLLAADAISSDYYDQRANASGVADASIKSSEAALTQAKLDVDHAYVKAPISGRVSRAEITLGNLVQTTPSPPILTSIVSDDGIYADFDVDEQTYMQIVRAYGASPADEKRIPVQLAVQGDSGHSYNGTIESFDNRIDTGTGTIRARARFDNKDGTLVPGLFVSVRIASDDHAVAMLVPEQAIGNDQSKRFVFVVGSDGRAQFREISLGREVDGQRVVVSGLNPGERVIVDGLQRVAPGTPVEMRYADNRSRRELAAR